MKKRLILCINENYGWEDLYLGQGDTATAAYNDYRERDDETPFDELHFYEARPLAVKQTIVETLTVSEEL